MVPLYDWFSDPDIQQQFKDIYGYDLGVPLNRSAYEDIAEFFTSKVNGDGTINGEKSMATWTMAKKIPALVGALPMSVVDGGAGDKGIPNGLPVDEVFAEECRPCIRATRGDTNGPRCRLRPHQIHRLAQSLCPQKLLA
ncbi:MAG: hypothetical protein R2865_11305 [Deinococcales bacterium]